MPPLFGQAGRGFPEKAGFHPLFSGMSYLSPCRLQGCDEALPQKAHSVCRPQSKLSTVHKEFDFRSKWLRPVLQSSPTAGPAFSFRQRREVLPRSGRCALLFVVSGMQLFPFTKTGALGIAVSHSPP